MDLSAFIVIITGILLFFGLIIWMAIYSRRTKPEEQLKITIPYDGSQKTDLRGPEIRNITKEKAGRNFRRNL